MQEWKETTIEDLADKNLGHLSFVDGDWIEAKHITSEGIRIIQTGNIGVGRYLDKPENKKFISSKSFEQLKCKKVFPGDLLICRLAEPIGRVCIVPDNEDFYVTAVDVVIFRPAKIHSKEFLTFLLNDIRILKLVNDQSGGSTRQRISRRNYGKIPIKIPSSIEEESKIAILLTTIDQAIEKTEQLIAKYERIKTGLIQDLLTRGIDEQGNIRSEKTHEFKDSPLGRIPKEWDVKNIGQITEYVGSGVTPKGGSTVYQNSGIILIRSQNVLSGELSLNDVAHISETINNSMLRSEIFENDVLLNITGASIGRCCVVPNDFRRANVNQHVCVLRLFKKNEDKATFLSTFLNSYWGQSQIARNNAGSNREGLNYAQIKTIELPFPNSDDEFKRIFEVLNSIEKILKNHKAENKKLNRQKTALMQDLLTGKVRVDNFINTKKAF